MPVLAALARRVSLGTLRHSGMPRYRPPTRTAPPVRKTRWISLMPFSRSPQSKRGPANHGVKRVVHERQIVDIADGARNAVFLLGRSDTLASLGGLFFFCVQGSDVQVCQLDESRLQSLLQSAVTVGMGSFNRDPTGSASPTRSPLGRG